MSSVRPLLWTSLILNAVVLSVSGQEVDRELARQQGTWQVTTFVSDGRETPPEIARSIQRTVEGDHVVWKRDGKPFAGTRMEVHPAMSPQGIDIIPDGGPRRGDRVLGIYKFEEDRFVICMAAPGKPRPKSFEAGKGTGLTLMAFRRLVDSGPGKSCSPTPLAVRRVEAASR